jgi:RNA 2',3'-cyclic 3'-phosphodiesterase
VLLPDDVRARLAAEIDALRPIAEDVAWVAANNLHISLKFLGQVDAGRLGEVEAALAAAAAVEAPFQLGLCGLGAYPTAGRPRVLWAGAAEGSDAAGRLATAVDEALAGVGFSREVRAFTPHVTLGRVRQPRRNLALAAVLTTGAHRAFGHVRVERVSLMRSELSPRGARYTELRALALAGAPSS